MKSRRVVKTTFRVAVIAVAAHCAPAQSHPKQTDTARDLKVGAPVIDSARPDSVVLPYGGVAEVTLHGSGFVPGQPGGNTVHFENATLNAIAGSADGQRIVFGVPDQISSGGEAPPMRLESGSYRVSVETPSGTSNAVAIRVYR
jgi:hypothetical protein